MIKKNTSVLFVPAVMVFTMACSLLGNENGKAQDSTCVRTVNYGTIEICLPSLDSLVECFGDSAVHIVSTRLEDKGNTIQAFYMTEVARNQIKETGFVPINDHVKVFTIDQLRDFNADSAYLTEVARAIQSQYKIEDWAELKYKLDLGADFMATGQPVFIEQYSPRPNVKSFITLFKVQNGFVAELSLGILNIILVKQRLIGATYYAQYLGQESLKQMKAKNDSLVAKMVEANGG